MLENKKRSFMKAVSWRVTGTIDTIAISYLITGKVALAFSIGGIEVFTKFFLYFLHERAWNRISFGRHKETKDDYVI